MKENFTLIPSRSRPRLFLECLVRPSAGNFALELRDLELLGLHLAVAWKACWGSSEKLSPDRAIRRMNLVLRRLRSSISRTASSLNFA